MKTMVSSPLSNVFPKNLKFSYHLQLTEAQPPLSGKETTKIRPHQVEALNTNSIPATPILSLKSLVSSKRRDIVKANKVSNEKLLLLINYITIGISHISRLASHNLMNNFLENNKVDYQHDYKKCCYHTAYHDVFVLNKSPFY